MGMSGELWEVDELNYYIATLELHGLMWFSSQTHPYPAGFVQTQLPVIHNYPVLLALQGQICEESYIARYNTLKRETNPASLFKEMSIYSYPIALKRVVYKKILMSMAESDLILYKPQTRACVPIMSHYNAISSGSIGETVIISKDELRDELYLRFGVKRFGLWRALLTKARARVVKGVKDIYFPFNVSDSVGLLDYTLVMKHYAGDIAISGRVSKALMLEVTDSKLVLPLPRFISHGG